MVLHGFKGIAWFFREQAIQPSPVAMMAGGGRVLEKDGLFLLSQRFHVSYE
jgi:hypothetical protein